jgi:hypothetical protein
MHRTFALVVLGSLGLACGSGSTDFPGAAATVNQQAPLNPQDPSANSQAPTTSSQAPTTACNEPATRQTALAALEPIFCDKAAACGQTVHPVTGQNVPDMAFWALACAGMRICAQNPDAHDCTDNTDLQGLDVAVCLNQITDCYQALVDMVSCDPTDAETQNLTPPPECASLVQLSQSTSATGMPGAAGAGG